MTRRLNARLRALENRGAECRRLASEILGVLASLGEGTPEYEAVAADIVQSATAARARRSQGDT